jgi:MerR family transcriptional regulator, mercuric resistance operon regulatory protein
LTAVKDLSIGQVSALTGVGIETIRYYEKVSLLPEPPRTVGGHRLYANDHVKRLIFIRRSRALGFTIGEIGDLLALVDGGYTCGQVQKAALDHVKSIQNKIRHLRQMARTLANTAARCRGGTAPACPIIEVLSRPL